ncbi:MAG: metal-dependent transcriptional regulator, partial [Chloroflexi bacterium]|nr:metal-dependent transcriptional regulator [Chloroflexota bacterium]
MPDHDRGQRVAEDYAAAIAVLEAEGTPAIGARLAEALHVSAPTVTETLRRLEQNGFLHVEPSKDLNLTASGRELATRTLRRRRLVERFLVDSLGLPLTDAQVEADRIEHGLSETAADRLDQALGHPAECPHGYQIAES